MAVTTYEGIVENGKIRLKSGVKLPDNAKVYVIVTDTQEAKPRKTVRVLTPHLAKRKQVADFKMKISKA
jgi:hypothetical protein